MNCLSPFRLKLLGGTSLQTPGGEPLVGQAAQRHRLALLALLARAPEGGMSREKLQTYLWPESDTARARNLLNVSVYVLRKALGEDALLSSADHLRLNLHAVRVDVVEFEAALARGEPAAAVASYDGPFLDGFFLGNAAEFEQWIDRERDRIARAYAAALEQLAEAAEARGDPAAAGDWWKERAAHDPFDSRVARRLLRALDAAGNPAAALQHAVVHERLLQIELGVGLDAETRAIVETIRARSTVDARPAAPAPAGARRPDPPGSAPVTATHGPPYGRLGAARGTREEADAFIRASTPPKFRLRPLGLAAAGIVLAAVGLAALLSIVPRSADRPGAAAGPDTTSGPVPVPASQPPPRSVAVLPFVNLSHDPDEEYFSDGLTEELIGALARIDALRVSARTSSFAFKGRTGDIREMGAALNVAAVLEGSVRRDGDRLVVTAQLIDVADGFHLWSETYDRRFAEIFDLQRDLALQIAGALTAELTSSERARLASPPTAHLDAYTAYLKGRHFWAQRTPVGFARAIEYFQAATAADPQYAQAYAGLAAVYSLQGLAGTVRADSARELARTAALRAVELGADIAETHAVLGLYLHVFEWDAAAAEREFLQSITLDPNHALTRQSYGNLLAAMGRLDEAVIQKQKAVELDPLVPALSETLAFTLVRADRLDEAKLHVENALELDSTYWRAHAVAGLIHERRGRHQDAIRAYEVAGELGGATTHRMRADIARTLARSGRHDQARALVHELTLEAERTGVYDPSVATVLLALADTSTAFDWLDHALRRKHPHLAYVGGDARFAEFDGDPRFADLMRRVGLWR